VQAPSNSIAVLPFVNMSGARANEYFSDGISEEILNVVARSPGLQVAARTASVEAHDHHLRGSRSGRPGAKPICGRRSSTLDGRSPIVGENHAFVLTALGRHEDARALCEQVLGEPQAALDHVERHADKPYDRS